MKLATIEKIDKLKAHPNADKLEIVEVLGYQCVVPKDLHKEGDFIVYIQPDTVLPKNRKWAEEYIKYSPKRVKAVKLRGEWSEGVVAPMTKFLDMGYEFGLMKIIPKPSPDATGQYNIPTIKKVGESDKYSIDLTIGLEVSDLIDVTKYEPPLPPNESAVGGLPYQMGKTDEERFENMIDKIPFGEKCDVTLKIDGQSATYGYKIDEDRFFATGRRFEVSTEEENRYSIHVEKIKEKIIEYCKNHNISLAFRGESYGNGIQKNNNNPHSKKQHSFAVFSIWNIDERKYENFGSEHYFLNVCKQTGLEHVPIVERKSIITPQLLEKYSKRIKKINLSDKMIAGHPFEGVVLQHKGGSFKVINKHYDSNK